MKQKAITLLLAGLFLMVAVILQVVSVMSYPKENASDNYKKNQRVNMYNNMSLVFAVCSIALYVGGGNMN